MSNQPKRRVAFSERAPSAEEKARQDVERFASTVEGDRLWGPVQGLGVGASVLAFLSMFVFGMSSAALFVIGVGMIASGVAALRSGQVFGLDLINGASVDLLPNRRSRIETHRTFANLHGPANILVGIIALVFALLR